MILALLLLLHAPDIRDCQRIKAGDVMAVKPHGIVMVLDNHPENWQLITRTPGTLQQTIRRYEDLKCYKSH
jgi:hypothetical protein